MIAKYFNFEGTVSGTQYFVRALIASIIIIIGINGFFLEVFEVNHGKFQMFDFIMLMTGILILWIGFWYRLATIYKRAYAFFKSDHLARMTASILIFLRIIHVIMFYNISIKVRGNLELGKTYNNLPVAIIFTIATLLIIIAGLILIFKNSDIAEHNG